MVRREARRRNHAVDQAAILRRLWSAVSRARIPPRRRAVSVAFDPIRIDDDCFYLLGLYRGVQLDGGGNRALRMHDRRKILEVGLGKPERSAAAAERCPLKPPERVLQSPASFDRFIVTRQPMLRELRCE